MAATPQAQGSNRPSVLDRLGQSSGMWIAAATVLIIGLMIVPIPPELLDFLLTLNITAAVLILLTTLYTENALSFSVFPTLLLIITLFRLSLNISGTRLILLHAYAGRVIEAFGNVVVGGNYAVGIIIFAILIIIQFVVITNGAGRVAEVAARFTLDAMPGKQLAIDADLNAGLITEAEARQRRRDIQRSADFYGAMDGASKFVRGDAVAAVIIVFVNIIGGFFIGILQQGLTLMQALQRFTLLTVGEGIVTQIPALLMSTATGIIVTRAASEMNFGNELTRQILQEPRAIAITAVLLIVFGFTGLPWMMFVMAGVMAVIFMRQRDLQRRGLLPRGDGTIPALAAGAAAPGVQPGVTAQPAVKPAESVVPLLSYDPMELEIGFGLIPLVDVAQGGDLLERITMIRRHAARELGIVVPPIRVRDNLQLKPSTYVIKIYGLE
ncbi:MAG: FHIPEP family type III secretion protein, partial [Candidatus Eremiobacteraeota bacterium]|nr:FHIPEP family type III secretion protein [Candidatus Eremiobacteraeota bacterium]